MLAGEIFRRALHGGKIGLIIEHGNVFPVEDRLRIADVAGVGVELADGAVARVEAVGGELRLLHADIVREVPVHIVADLLRCFLRVHIGVGCHGPCVDACVRAACADDLHVHLLDLIGHSLHDLSTAVGVLLQISHLAVCAGMAARRQQEVTFQKCVTALQNFKCFTHDIFSSLYSVVFVHAVLYHAFCQNANLFMNFKN